MAGLPSSHLHKVIYTRWCINTIDLLTMNIVLFETFRGEINKYIKGSASSWLLVIMQILCVFYEITRYKLRFHIQQYPPAPLACTTLSGIRSLSKRAMLSTNITSCRSMGPLEPAVRLDVMSSTGAPNWVCMNELPF